MIYCAGYRSSGRVVSLRPDSSGEPLPFELVPVAVAQEEHGLVVHGDKRLIRRVVTRCVSR